MKLRLYGLFTFCLFGIQKPLLTLIVMTYV